MSLSSRVTAFHFAAALILAVCAGPVRAADVDLWPSIRDSLFGAKEISDSDSDSDSAISLFAPAQAADAALVPVSIHMPQDIARKAKQLTLIIDRNPAPIAATVQFEDAFRSSVAIGERVLATRIRVDSFSKVRAILELTDGTLHMDAHFVAGAGGCSALPSKDEAEALANLGKVRVKSISSSVHEPAWREGVIMVRHPNATGMQMNPKTGNFTPARFVNSLVVKSGDQVLFKVEGGIAISEDPNFRFTYAAPNNEVLSVSGRDTEGTTFSGNATEPQS